MYQCIFPQVLADPPVLRILVVFDRPEILVYTFSLMTFSLLSSLLDMPLPDTVGL